MNGTAGIYEEAKFSNGTLELLNIVTSSSAKTIAGGGVLELLTSLIWLINLLIFQLVVVLR